MKVKVTHTIGRLERKYRAIPVRAARDLAEVVQHNVTRGEKLAQGIARAKSGPHGRLYYKRITSEMRSPFIGEFGPTGDVVGNAVGAGWRGGPANNDLEQAADVIGPNFERMVRTRTGWWF